MVRFIRSRKYNRFMHKQAVEYAKEAARLINKKYPEVRFTVYNGLFGSVETIYWMADFDGLASLEQWLKKVDAEEWHAFYNSIPAGVFIDGTANEMVMALE